jgi:hypothetical protein
MDYLTKYLVEAHVEDLRRDARRVPPMPMPFDARHRKRQPIRRRRKRDERRPALQVR